MDKTYSFIIPHHNTPSLLYRLLETIPQREDIEIIVVDDNSNIHNIPVITRPDVRLIKIQAADSKGAGHARNIGLNQATGKWLLFADSDDYYDSRLIPCLDQYKDYNIDILYFSAYTNVIHGNAVSSEYNAIDNSILAYESSSKGPRDIQKLGLSSNAPWNKMFNSSFIRNIDAHFEEIPISNDAWFVNYAGSMAKSILAIKDKLYYYVLNDSGITKRQRPKKHYYLAMKSNKRRNMLKWQCGLIELVTLPGFNSENILRDFGRLTYIEFFLYKLVTDKIIRKRVIKFLLSKLC